MSKKGADRMKEMKHGVICRMPHDPLGYFGWASVTRMDDGTLIAGASGMRHAHVCPWGNTTLFFSKDDGKTWSEPVVVHDSPLDDRDAGVVSLKNDIVLTTWFTLDPRLFTGSYENWADEAMKNRMRARLSALSDATAKEYAGSWTRISFDGGKTFSAPRRCPVSAPHGPILLKNGTLLYMGKQFPEDMERPFGQVAVAISLDLGMTWKEISICPLPEGIDISAVHEPHVVQLPDGTLIGTLRVHEFPNDPGTVYQINSTDGGYTWSQPVRLPVNGTPPHIMRHSSGVLICSYGYRHKPYGERVIFSKDDGKTWIHDMALREDGPSGDLGYPATVELADGSLITVYYQQAAEGENTSILYTKWNLPEDL